MIPKIRAWEKSLKEMIPVDNIDFKGRLINKDSAWRMFDEVEIMQSTGAYDKKGVAIYEGDIIDYENGKQKIFNACVEWDSEYAQFRLVNKIGEYIDSRPLLGRLSKKCSKVKGNKYEHPHLLKEDEQNAEN